MQQQERRSLGALIIQHHSRRRDEIGTGGKQINFLLLQQQQFQIQRKVVGRRNQVVPLKVRLDSGLDSAKDTTRALETCKSRSLLLRLKTETPKGHLQRDVAVPESCLKVTVRTQQQQEEGPIVIVFGDLESVAPFHHLFAGDAFLLLHVSSCGAAAEALCLFIPIPCVVVPSPLCAAAAFISPREEFLLSSSSICF